MNDFLHRLYCLTRTPRRLPTEDFASLCLGRQLERDPGLARHLISALVSRLPAEDGAVLSRWCARSAGQVSCRAQVPRRTPDATRTVCADLLLTLHGDTTITLIIEAKVGSGVPSTGQLEQYRQAFSIPLVVPLVESRVVSKCPEPSLTWDDVLSGLKGGPEIPGRADLQRLFIEAGVGDARLALDSGTWQRATDFETRFARLERKLWESLIQLGPNETVREQLQAGASDPEHHDEPTDGWGVGVWFSKRLQGSRIRGLCLGLDAGPFGNELIWTLEVCPTGKKLTKHLRQPDSGWRALRGASDWFGTEIHLTRGDRNLLKGDFAQVIRKGRIALRELHRHCGGSWNTRGGGSAPYAPRLPIADIHAGLSSWEPVNRSLECTVKKVLARVVAAFDLTPDKRPYQWHRDAWRTGPDRLPGGIRLRASVPDLQTLRFEREAAGTRGEATLADALKDWPDSLPAVSQDSGVLLVTLTRENWILPELPARLTEVLIAAVSDSSRVTDT